MPIMGYFHKVQIFMNAALLALAEIFTIQKFTTLNSCNQHLMKIYSAFVVRIMQLATTHDRDLRLSSRLRFNFHLKFWSVCL